MRYHCVQCDREFEVEEGDDRPRCPQCLRQHGLRRIERAAQPVRTPRSRTWLWSGALVIALGIGAYFAWQRVQGPPRAAAGAELDASALRERARALTGLDLGDAADLLSADPALEQFAKRATQGASTADDRARAIVRALAARAKTQAFVGWSSTDPRETPALTAAATLHAIEQDGARRELYPLELAALAVAALRSLDVPAQLVDVGSFGQERAPLDPSGRIGYFALGLPGAARADTGTPAPRVYDVFGGRAELQPAGDAAALSDEQALSALLSLRASQRLVHESDPTGALQLADAALRLAPSSAVARGVRAAVLLASGGKEEGERELEAAAQLRSGPAQHNNLAMYALATGDADRAAKLVASALSAAPDYAAGHLTLASVHLARLEREQAQAELIRAEQLDPKLPALPMAWAELYAASGDLGQAEQKAQDAVQKRPKSPETHLLLARIQRQAGHYDAMRQEARIVLELAPAAQKDQFRQVLRAVLGPTALESPTDRAAEGEAEQPTTQPDRPPGSLQLGAGEPKLRLGDSKLKLDLTH